VAKNNDMPSEWLNPILEWVGKHLSLRWVVAICCVAALLLFLPQSYIARFGLLEFSQKNHVLITLVFFITVAFLATYLISWLRQLASDAIQRRRFLRHGKVRLHGLSVDEKVILRRFVHAGGSVLNLDIMNGTTLVLRDEGFIYAPVLGGRWHLGRLGGGFPYKIQPWVLQYLNEHPECLR
jgi:superinfection exclusion protein B